MDSASETLLHDFIKMKQKLARQRETVGTMGLRKSAPSSPQRRSIQTMKTTFKLAADLSKWLRDNESNFIEEFRPAHMKYGMKLSKSSNKYGSQSVK